MEEFDTYGDWIKSLEERITVLENGIQRLNSQENLIKCRLTRNEIRALYMLVRHEVAKWTQQPELIGSFNADLLSARNKLLSKLRTDQSGADQSGTDQSGAENKIYDTFNNGSKQ